MFTRIPSIISIILIGTLLHAWHSAAHATRSICIATSGVGNGHLTTAFFAQSLITRHASLNPNLPFPVFHQINIWDHALPGLETMRDRVYFPLIRRGPLVRNLFYYPTNWAGNLPSGGSSSTQSLFHRAIKKASFLEELTRNKCEVIISTDYFSADSLRVLREQGHLSKARIAWIFTEYGSSYFPKIGKFFDKTFLPDQGMIDEWITGGTPEEQLVATGLTVPNFVRPDGDVQDIATRLGIKLDPTLPKIVIGGGGQGIAPFYQIMDSLEQLDGDTPVQVVALTGENAAARRKLERGLRSNRWSNSKLAILPKIDAVYARVFTAEADVLVTKGGALATTEAIAFGTPMVLLNASGGIEKANIQYLAKEGLALQAGSAAEVGVQVERLLNSEEELVSMKRAQALFTSRWNRRPIAEFALGGEKPAILQYPSTVLGRLLKQINLSCSRPFTESVRILR